MHILFVHQNFPAQFGHIAGHLVQKHGYRCTFVSELPDGVVGGIRRIQYRPRGGATAQTSYFTSNFENAVAHAHGVYEACRRHPDLAPDLIVGHSGFGSTLFLNELFPCPIINYFELLYRPHDSDMDYRPEFAPSEDDTLRSYLKNAMILLDLQQCRAGYCPTPWQKSTLPGAYADKVEVIFDGIDTGVWHRHEGLPRKIGDRTIGPETKVVTYVSRGFEATRGFDIFMKAARRIYRRVPDVVFAVVGADRVAYGGDLKYIREKSFYEHALNQDDYDLSKFLFLGNVPPRQLAQLLSIGDVHMYLTVPFVLSWSLFNALACGCAVVSSKTPPVQDLIRHGHNGLLADFYDVEGLADHAVGLLRDPGAARALGDAGIETIREHYTLERSMTKMLDLYRRVVSPPRPARSQGLRRENGHPATPEPQVARR